MGEYFVGDAPAQDPTWRQCGISFPFWMLYNWDFPPGLHTRGMIYAISGMEIPYIVPWGYLSFGNVYYSPLASAFVFFMIPPSAVKLYVSDIVLVMLRHRTQLGTNVELVFHFGCCTTGISPQDSTQGG
jgi:hypothetical protein